MLHSSKADVDRAARNAVRDLKRMARPLDVHKGSGAGKSFDASRYFRGDHNFGFYNVGTKEVRALARSIWAAHSGPRPRAIAPWGINEAMGFADALIVNRYLEVKGVAIEVVGRYCKIERYLRGRGHSIPRTTVRYAIERFPPAKRRALLAATKGRDLGRGRGTKDQGRIKDQGRTKV